MNEQTHFFIKIYLSHFILERMILFTQPLRSGRIWHKVDF